MWSIQFDGNRLKTLQEEMIAAYSRLLDALKEFEAEAAYLSGIWKGDAANCFFDVQRQRFEQIKECADQTEELLGFPENAENIFRKCEQKAGNIVGEICIWEM